MASFPFDNVFSPGWKLLTGVNGKCLGYKIGSLDQLNQFELRILYAMVCNKYLDFGHMIFDQLVSLIRRRRPIYVTFSHFLAMTL